MKLFLIALCILGMTLGFFDVVSAAESYKSLVELPIPKGITPSGGEAGYTTQDFIKILYALSISVAALLAVVKIIFGGVKYMLSDVVTDKGNAKKDIKGALLGLLIVISAVLILNTINPQLRSLSFFTNVPTAPIEWAGGLTNNTTAGDNLPDHLQPTVNQSLRTIACDTSGVVTDCTAANQECSDGGGIRTSDTPRGGSMLCYIYEGGNSSTCTGYLEPHSGLCYDSDPFNNETLDMSDFTEVRPDLRQAQCEGVLNGKYNPENGLCYEVY